MECFEYLKHVDNREVDSVGGVFWAVSMDVAFQVYRGKCLFDTLNVDTIVTVKH